MASPIKWYERWRRPLVIARVRFYVSSDDPEADRAVSNAFLRLRGEVSTRPDWSELQRLLTQVAQASIPAEVSIVDVKVETEGSAFIDAVVLGWGIVVGYGALRQGLDYFVRDASSILRRLSRQYGPTSGDVDARGVWIPGPGFRRLGKVVRSAESHSGNPTAGGLLMLYLLLTNLLLLTGLVAFVWKALQWM